MVTFYTVRVRFKNQHLLLSKDERITNQKNKPNKPKYQNKPFSSSLSL